jgi:predicted P-loop ATPase
MNFRPDQDDGLDLPWAPGEKPKKRKKTKQTKRLEPADPDWRERCLKTEKGALIPNVFNACEAIDGLGIGDRLAFDEMLRRPTITKRKTRPLQDTDVVNIQKRLQNQGLARIGRDTVHDAVIDRAHARSFHPVREYLDALVWDGNERLRTWTSDYLGTPPTAYESAIGIMFLVSMVARIFEPGCKVDHMLVLEGPQGELKSSACRVLAGGYFSDSLPEIHSAGKDVMIHLRGKWIVEIAEMHAVSRAEATQLKSFLSRQEEQFRPPHGRQEVVEPRQCVFIGTSNKDAYLRDETGGRRFWPVKCGQIDIAKLSTDRDQLLAEAVHEFQAGTHYWPDKQFERDVIQPEQEARYEDDAWTQPLADHVAGSMQTEFNIADVAKIAINLDAPRLDLGSQKRIAAILRKIGLEQRHTKRGNVWVRPQR